MVSLLGLGIIIILTSQRHEYNKDNNEIPELLKGFIGGFKLICVANIEPNGLYPLR